MADCRNGSWPAIEGFVLACCARLEIQSTVQVSRLLNKHQEESDAFNTNVRAQTSRCTASVSPDSARRSADRTMFGTLSCDGTQLLESGQAGRVQLAAAVSGDRRGARKSAVHSAFPAFSRARGARLGQGAR